jgi:glycerophosphoryl diester phosphodiesterase
LLAKACSAAGDALAVSTYTLDPVHCCGLSDTMALQDPGEVWGRLIEAGVTVIMTDQARDLAAYLEPSGA